MKNPFRTIQVLFDDEHLLAVTKPAGVASVHDGGRPKDPDLHTVLVDHEGELFTIHRLDKDTSGVIVFARTEEAHRAMSVLFESREVQKTYHAIVSGVPTWKEHTVDAALLPDADRRHRTLVDMHNGKPAVTHFRMLKPLKQFALVEALPETGRTHQIRVHAAQMGHPVAVDELYGSRKPILLSAFKRGYRMNTEEELPLMGRLALHALRLQFTHPISGEPLDLQAPYPKDFHATINQLGKLT
jgi:RluA family pseudouridine synthase